MLEHKKEGIEFWRTHNIKWEKSAISQKRYCEEQGLVLTTFCYWRSLIIKKQDTKVNFIEIKRNPQEQDLSKPLFQFILPNGVRFGLMNGQDKTLLKEVLTTLGHL